MAQQGRPEVPAGRVPQPHRPVAAGGGQASPIGRPGHPVDLVGMAVQRGERPNVRGVPEADGPVLTAGSQPAAIRRPRHALDAARVAHLALPQLGARGLPDQHLLHKAGGSGEAHDMRNEFAEIFQPVLSVTR